MAQPPETRPSLLIRMRDAADNEAWSEFIDLYEPLLRRFYMRSGLQAADASDLTQEVLRAVARSIGQLEYDPQIGRFRSWLLTIARNKLKNYYASRQRKLKGSGDTRIKNFIEEVPDDDREIEQIWEKEYQQRVFDWAVERIRGSFQQNTWKAFWGTAVDNRDPGEVADELGMSTGAVYIAKSRVVAKLREKIELIGDL